MSFPRMMTYTLAICAALLNASDAPGSPLLTSDAKSENADVRAEPRRDGAGHRTRDKSLGFGCPGTGNCCEANGTPGCDDFLCCDEVCFIDDFCCDVGWDTDCAGFAIAFCDPSACGGGCPGTGDCCVANGTPGCSDASCCDLVCTQDSFCCEGAWDSDCAALAGILCGNLCATCPGEGDCCEANGTPGCDDTTCCEDVCELAPACCDSEWTGPCASLAESLCPTHCFTCPGDGDCFVANGTPGCDDPVCCDAVCNLAPDCCADAWDATCANLAQNICIGCPNCLPDSGECCVANDSPGCEDPDCCNIVSEVDPYCCSDEWDAICAEEANALCCSTCKGNCPGEGGCCCEHDNAGCDDRACCQVVCDVDSTCCTDVWDQACADLAAELCSGGCDGVSCPGEGDCCEANLTPACNDAACTDIVCGQDFFCCISWDENCRLTAVDKCEICSGPCPGDGDCCSANGTPGCEERTCCERVCALDSACCDQAGGWDADCAELAIEECVPTCFPCPSGQIVFRDPESGTVDARQPHPPHDPNTLQGIDSFTINGPTGAALRHCWTLCETATRGAPNCIAEVDLIEGETDKYTVTLERPLTPGAVTTIIYTDDVGTESRGVFTAHPANANADSFAHVEDLNVILDTLQGEPGPLFGVYSTDINHSGAVTGADLLRIIDLLNGGDDYDLWGEQPLTELPQCDFTCCP